MTYFSLLYYYELQFVLVQKTDVLVSTFPARKANPLHERSLVVRSSKFGREADGQHTGIGFCYCVSGTSLQEFYHC